MFRLRRLAQKQIHAQVVVATGNRPASPWFLSIGDGRESGDLGAFSHDQSRSCLGYGKEIFAAARSAFKKWQMFDLGWARVANPEASIACGQVVAVEVHSLGLWSVNLSQILETVDSETQFGFLYSTTVHHLEQGEETFILRFDSVSGEVGYELEAVSRPRDLLAQVGYPITRHYQHRFARDSHRRMRQAVTLNS